MAQRKATAAKRPAPKKRDAEPVGEELLRLEYSLAELPSAQHRAGLAGLVLMARWLERLRAEAGGTCRISRLDDRGATVEIDLAGMRRVFDELYAATAQEQESAQLRKDKEGHVVEPIRKEERQVEGASGKVKTKTVYFYPVTVPKAGMLADWDRTGGAWVKLWRDMLWTTLRGVPATRAPFEARAAGEKARDAEDAWGELQGRGDESVELPSTYFLGAMASSADNVPFRDRGRYRFLLHFWPYVAQVYVPARRVVEEGRARLDFDGYALTIPDVSRLRAFCDSLPETMRTRGSEMAGYRPRDAVVDLPVEGALDMAARLRARLSQLEGGALDDVVLGFEVFHLRKDGNNVRTLSTSRIEPDVSMTNEYERIRDHLEDPLFRHQRLWNLVHGRPWYAGFDRVLQTASYKTETLGSRTFRHDARETFALDGGVEMEKQSMAAPDAPVEQLVYQLVGAYVRRKAEAKTGREWAKVKDSPEAAKEYNEAKNRVAKDAFLAVRGRTGADFISYFAGTLCSVPQFIGQEQFPRLAQALHQETDKVRTLTLLALSAWG